MPVVTINTLELLGYQKKNIAKKVTEILSNETNVPEDRIYVFFSGYPLDGIAAGGVLNSDVPEAMLKTFITKDIEALKEADDLFVIKSYKALNGMEAQAEKALMGLVIQMRAATGCVDAELFRGGVDIMNKTLEDATFFVKERWTDKKVQTEFEEGLEYKAFLLLEGIFGEGKWDTAQRVDSIKNTQIRNTSKKLYVTMEIQAKEAHKSKVNTRIFDFMERLKNTKGCIGCDLYRSFSKEKNANIYLLKQAWENSNAFNEAGICNYDNLAFNINELLTPMKMSIINQVSISLVPISENGVFGDAELMAGLAKLNPDFGDLCVQSSGIPWGKPLLDQKTKVLIAIAVDVVEQITGKPFENHLLIAKKQGITREEIEELLLFMTIYAGFNKAGVFYGELNRIFGPKK